MHSSASSSSFSSSSSSNTSINASGSNLSNTNHTKSLTTSSIARVFDSFITPTSFPLLIKYAVMFVSFTNETSFLILRILTWETEEESILGLLAWTLLCFHPFLFMVIWMPCWVPQLITLFYYPSLESKSSDDVSTLYQSLAHFKAQWSPYVTPLFDLSLFHLPPFSLYPWLVGSLAWTQLAFALAYCPQYLLWGSGVSCFFIVPYFSTCLQLLQSISQFVTHYWHQSHWVHQCIQMIQFMGASLVLSLIHLQSYWSDLKTSTFTKEEDALCFSFIEPYFEGLDIHALSLISSLEE